MQLPRRVFGLVVAAILAMPVVSFGQSERGAISGLVTDETKAAVPGVSIKVVNAGTNLATNVVSSESGGFSATNLPPGTYRIDPNTHEAHHHRCHGLCWPIPPMSTHRVILSLPGDDQRVAEARPEVTVRTDGGLFEC